MDIINPSSRWTVQEAKSKLSEVLRRARNEGPQYVGNLDPCVVISKKLWESQNHPTEIFAKWLVKTAPQGADLEIPDRKDNDSRANPYGEMDV